MLKIHVGELPNEIKKPSGYFDLIYEDSWFDDPFVKQMVLDVDKTIVYSANNMLSPVLGNINSSKISGGVKNLILAYALDSPIIDASHCGDNCAKWLIEIGKRKDLTITLYHCMGFPQDFEALILNTNQIVHSFKEYAFAVLLLLYDKEGTDEK